MFSVDDNLYFLSLLEIKFEEMIIIVYNDLKSGKILFNYHN